MTGEQERAPGGQLPRGAHSLTRAQVQSNQRERIMTAMVELVGEQGYGASSVTEVAQRAGVSRKAFYQQFANKQECFLATYDALVAEGLDRVSAAAHDGGGLQDELGLGLGAVFQRSIETPSIQRLVLLEVAAVGPAGIQRREQLISSYEGILREQLGAPPRPGIIPNPLLRAIVGGIQRVLYTRVQSGAQRKLPALIAELVRWSFTYYPLPATIDAIGELSPPAPRFVLAAGRAPGTLSPWSTSPRRRAANRRTPNVSRSFIVHSQRERILDALALLSVEQGYANIKVDEIARRAAVSLEAFYEHFTDKQDAFLVAYEIGHGKSLALVEQARRLRNRLAEQRQGGHHDAARVPRLRARVRAHGAGRRADRHAPHSRESKQGHPWLRPAARPRVRGNLKPGEADPRPRSKRSPAGSSSCA